jgi:phosphoribosylglycinamide formyltransferase-1
VLDDDTAETLGRRILDEEHRAYVDALAALATRRWHIEGRRVVFT